MVDMDKVEEIKTRLATANWEELSEDDQLAARLIYLGCGALRAHEFLSNNIIETLLAKSYAL